MRIISLIKKKMVTKRGETLIETLYSLLIIVPAMVMLAGAIVTAARINNEARSSNVSNLPKFSFESDDENIESKNGQITGTDFSKNITWVKEADSIYYYFISNN